MNLLGGTQASPADTHTLTPIAEIAEYVTKRQNFLIWPPFPTTRSQHATICHSCATTLAFVGAVLTVGQHVCSVLQHASICFSNLRRCSYHAAGVSAALSRCMRFTRCSLVLWRLCFFAGKLSMLRLAQTRSGGRCQTRMPLRIPGHLLGCTPEG